MSQNSTQFDLSESGLHFYISCLRLSIFAVRLLLVWSRCGEVLKNGIQGLRGCIVEVVLGVYLIWAIFYDKSPDPCFQMDCTRDCPGRDRMKVGFHGLVGVPSLLCCWTQM